MNFRECHFHPERYTVSDCGKVFSNWRGETTEIKSFKSNSGYLKLGLWKDSKRYNFYVHHLVAFAWIGYREDGKVLNHINGNKKDNSAKNLEWVTQSENVTKSIDTEVNPNTGQGHYKSRLSKSQVLNIIELIKEDSLTLKEIASRYEISYGTIYGIATKRNWKSLWS